METNNNKRRALGRGLEELFFNEPIDYNKVEEKIITETPKEAITMVKLSELRSNPYQPRKVFDEDALKELVEFDEGSHYIGEVALVPFHSPISEMNVLFYNTLFDENAACHLALGDSFTECINEVGTKEDLFNKFNMNNSKSHVDFMIGTKDLNIKGITQDNKEIDIFINGNFTEEFN